MAGRVAGKVALITGAARGQGRAHAVRLAEEGADIIAVDVCGPLPHIKYPAATEEDMADTVKGVEALGQRIVARTADVRDRSSLGAAIADGMGEFGRLDVVIANAGIAVMAPWDEVTPELWQDTIDINLTGVWNTVTLSAKHIIDGGSGGSIILTSSAAGLKGLPFLTHYVASKHGVLGLARAFAHELAKHHIRVNSLHPTSVRTPMARGTGHTDAPAMIEKHNPRLGAMYTKSLPIDSTEPEDQANAVLFLASDESRYITAQALAVDAGETQY